MTLTLSSITGWIGRRFKLTDSAFYAAVFGGGSTAGKTVTLEGALKISAWWSCVRLISEAVGTLPIGIFERTREAKKERLDHELYELLSFSPNADQDEVQFWEGKTAALCMVGNAFAEKRYSGERLVALNRMPFEDVRPIREADGRLIYRFTDRGREETLPEDKVFHIRGFGVDGDMGLSPIAYARESIGTAMVTDEAAAKMYGSGMRASGFLMIPQTLNQTQRQQVQQNIVKPMEGSDAEGRMLLLEQGWKFQPTNIAAKDAELILSRRFSVEDVCRFMRVPPILIGHATEGQTMWGSGVEQIMIAWLTLGLRPYLKRIESAIVKQLLKPGERTRIFAEFNVEGLLRADSKGRGDLYSKLLQVGSITPNEIRAKENLPRSSEKNADKLFVNSTMTLIERAGDKPPAPAAIAPAEQTEAAA